MNASTTSFSSSCMSPSRSVPSLSFAGTLMGSVQYERKSQRLPPVDPDHLTYMSQRRLQANAAMLHRDVSTAETGEGLARKRAEKRMADLEALRMVDLKRESGLRSARRTLMHSRDGRLPNRSSPNLRDGGGHIKHLTPQQHAEAIRETARDCMRKEQLNQLRAQAAQAENLANQRADELEHQRQSEEERVQRRAHHEEAWLQRKVDFEEARLRGMLSSATEREDAKAEVTKRRNEHEAALREVANQRAADREARAQEKRLKAEAAEVAKEVADEKRRKEKLSLHLIKVANRAAELNRAAEQVWIQADALASRCQSDLDRLRNTANLLGNEPPEEEHERLLKKLQVAQERSKSAKKQFDEATHEANAAERKAKEAVLAVKP